MSCVSIFVVVYVGRLRHFGSAVPLDCEGGGRINATLRDQDKDGTVSVEAALSNTKVTEPVRLTVAVVEKSTETEVSRGENRGKRLVHTNVVRAVSTVKFENPDVKARVDLEWPDDLQRADAELIVYAQHFRSLRVLAATRIELDAEPNP